MRAIQHLCAHIPNLQRGLAVRVFNSTTEKWEAGFIQRQHRDGTFKILLEDGHAEPHIASDRIAITRDMLRSVSSFASSFESHNSVSSTPGDSDGGFPRQQSGDVDVSSHSKDSHLSSFSQNLTRDWLDRVKNGRDSSSKIEFVIEYPGDDIEWMGDSGAEDNDDAKSHESPLTATNIKSQAESGSINKNMDVQTPCSTNTFKVDFPCPPMGFTLNKSVSGHAHVTKITPGGQASCSPVKLGDCVVEINGIVVNGYDDFMKSMLTVTYPALVTFFRKKKAEDTPDSSASQHRAAAAASNSSSMRKDDVTLPDAYKELVQATHAMRTPSGTGTVRPEVSRMQSAPASIGVPKIRSMSPMASKLLMEDTPDTYMVQGELRDVCFSEVSLSVVDFYCKHDAVFPRRTEK